MPNIKLVDNGWDKMDANVKKNVSKSLERYKPPVLVTQ